MNSTFMAFNRAASALPSIEPGLAQNLQTVALRFSTLASSTTSNQGLEEPPEEMPALAEIPQTGNDEGHYGTAINSDTQIAEATYTAVDTLRSTDGPVLAPWGYQFSAVPDEIDRGKAEEAIETVPENQFLTEPLAMDWHPTEPIEHSLVDFPVTVDEEQNLLPLYAEPLAPPSTYSFKESTFARRLLRASYERAWRVMTDPSKTAIKYEMCKFTFCFSNSANITNWIREMSLTTTKDSLELWVAPQLHIGSAGLRYPRTSLDGAQPPPSYWADQAPMGPRRSVLAETPMPDSMTVTEIIDRVGFQGDWYDPNDVEHYLRSKGLVLSEQSSWAELGENAVPMLEAPEVPAAGSPVSSGPGTGPPSPRNEDPLATVNPVLQDTDYFWSNTAANVLDNAISNVETQGANMPPVTKEPGSNISLPFFDDSYSFLNLTKRKVVNVDKFVGSRSRRSLTRWRANLTLYAAIVNDAVCLGRTPGWRKSTIDSALAMSLQEVF